MCKTDTSSQFHRLLTKKKNALSLIWLPEEIKNETLYTINRIFFCFRVPIEGLGLSISLGSKKGLKLKTLITTQYEYNVFIYIITKAK